MGQGSIPTLGGLNGDESNEELIDYVGRLQKTVNHLLRHLTSKNITEVGGYDVSETELMSKDGDVGLSSADDATDPVRIWAGSADKDAAPWRVHKSGKGVATGWRIQSTNGTYPLIIIDPDGELIAAIASPGNYVAFMPAPSFGGVPSLVFVGGGTTKAFMNRALAGGTTIGTFDSENLNLQASGNLQVDGTNGTTGAFYVAATPGGTTNMLVEFKKGFRTS